MERTVTIHTELESILVEQALAMARELERVSDTAPDGPVLAASETAALRTGRERTRRALEATRQRQADRAEPKGLPGGPAPAAGDVGSRTRRPGPR